MFDPNTGGPTIRVRAVYGRLQAAGHTVRVAYPKGEGSAAGFMAEHGIAVDRLAISKPVLPSKPLAFLKFAVTFPLALWRIAAYLRRHRPDVVHVNGAFDIGPAIGARLAGVPVVWHLNDTLFGPRLSRILGWFVRQVATVVVAAAGRVASHYGVADQARVIFAPVDVDRFAPRAVAGHPRARPVVGLLANWNWIKGQDRFVATIAGLRAQGRDVTGRVMGRFLDSQKGFWQPILDTMTRDGLDQVIETPGFVEDVPSALADLDVLLLTSKSEASPICVLEAMALGLPQVVFDVGGVREMLGEGPGAAGTVVAPDDVEAMVRAVGEILDKPGLYGEMAANGQARARAEFSLEACIARHLAVYRAAMSARPRRKARKEST